MNKDELEKEADNFCDKVNKRLLSTNYGVSPYSNHVSILDVQEAYIAGAEPREKRIAELETQIEKMKCCENCKYNSYWGNELHCNYGLKEALQEDKLVECKKMDKWEVSE